MSSTLHLSTNFHIIKKWITDRGGVPSKVTLRKKSYPTVAFKAHAHRHAVAVTWPQFFALMMQHDMAFMYEEGVTAETLGTFFKFIPREQYLDELKAEEDKEDDGLWRDMNMAFS